MLKRYFAVLSAFLILLIPAFPQGKGGGKGGGGGRGQGQGQTMGQGPGQSMERGQGQNVEHNTNAQGDQKRIKVTQQQRDQIRSCDKLADEIGKQARKMAKDSEKNLNYGQLNQHQVHIRNQIRKMEQEHERLMNGLDATQQQAWKEQIRNMNMLREQLNTHQRQMEDALKPNPDAKRVVERAREMERTMNEWRKLYGTLSSQAAL